MVEGERLFENEDEAQEFLDKKLPTEQESDAEEVERYKKEFFSPSEVEYGDEGTVEFMYKGIAVSIDYQKIAYSYDQFMSVMGPKYTGSYSEESEDKTQEKISPKAQLDTAIDAIQGKITPENAGNALYKINDIKLSGVDKFGKQIELNGHDFIPEGSSVFFSSLLEGDNISLSNVGVVVVGSEIKSIGNIFEMMHELGHVEHTSKMSEERINAEVLSWLRFLKGAFGGATTADLAHTLDSERTAWAFALAKLKPFITDNAESNLINRDGILGFVHQDALMRYKRLFRQSRPDLFPENGPNNNTAS